jgi:replicative DNA helicase
MSDNQPQSEALKKFQEAIEKTKAGKTDTQSLREKVQEKKLFVEDYKYTNELERIKKSEADLKIAEKVNVGIMTDEDILEVQERSRLYLESAKNGMTFLHESFRKWVPCWAGNIILVGARTGSGKSTLAANLLLSTIQQINPLTGKNRKVLCISAEETLSQVFNRLTCLVKNYDYNEQDEFTDEQKENLIKFIPRWAKNGVSVIGDDDSTCVASLEGLESILKNLLATKTYYDLIVIDYIQKFNTSSKNPMQNEYNVLKAAMKILDKFKNVYPGAIVVLSQLKAQNEEETLDFQTRLRGSSDIITPCTVALEMQIDSKLNKTRFIVKKNRYKGSTLGHGKDMGFKKGWFVPYTEEFQKEIAVKNEKKDYYETVGKHVGDKEKQTETKEKADV